MTKDAVLSVTKNEQFTATQPINVFVSEGDDSTFRTTLLWDNGSDWLTDENNKPILDVSKSYTFRRVSNATTHPFYIGASDSNEIILSGDGSSSSGITESQSLTLSFNGFDPTSNDELSYYCTIHSSMVGTFSVVEPSEAPPTYTVSIVGDAIVGSTLNATITASSGSMPTASAYAWKDNNDTSLGTDSTYTIQSTDVGKTITVTVTLDGS